MSVPGQLYRVLDFAFAATHNRRGDRHLNSALHIVAIQRQRHDPATKAYFERRRADGKTDREIY